MDACDNGTSQPMVAPTCPKAKTRNHGCVFTWRGLRCFPLCCELCTLHFLTQPPLRAPYFTNHCVFMGESSHMASLLGALYNLEMPVPQVLRLLPVCTGRSIEWLFSDTPVCAEMHPCLKHVTLFFFPRYTFALPRS